ncbi:PepSY domain-containing protein [Plastoroseomonas arctica]
MEAQGGRVTGIRTRDGCYGVHATNDRGERYEAMFHPGTLLALKVEIDQV